MKRKLRLYRRLYIISCIIGIVILYLCIIKVLIKVQVPIDEVIPTRNVTIKAGKIKEEEIKESKLNMIMVGDALIHSAVYEDAKQENQYNFNLMLENVKDYIKQYDLAFYNQESILGGKELGLSTYPRFNSPYEVGDAFRESGFNLVSLANNHTLDRGETAIINSKNYWNQFQNIMTAGSYSSQLERDEMNIQEANGIRYTLLAYTDTTNGLQTPNNKEYLVNCYNEEKVKTDILRVRDKVDVLLVSIHFGEEYTHNITKRQQEIAQFLSDNGVNIIIGHHPHVIQPIDFINNTMVVYSLGNFISAQRGVEKLTGLMVGVEIKKITKGNQTSIYIEKPIAELVYTASDEQSGYRKNFKLYRYKDLTEEVLPNYKTYQEKFLKIVTSKTNKVEAR